ncbi:MAG: carbohydrate ABC transporter permease [Christensenellales bacterium]|jgi:ABC-type sugar transport system permease subunit
MLRKIRKSAIWYTFLLPSLICLIVLTYIPTFTSVKYSFYNVSVLGFGETFAGFKNYRALLNNSSFYRALFNTIVMTVYGYSVIPIGFILACMINSLSGKKEQTFLRIGFFIPNMIAGISVVLVFRYVLLQNDGLLNSVLSFISGQKIRIGWLVDPAISKIGVSIISVWHGLGYTLLICLAGLQSIPGEIYEAAEVDSANSLQKWWYITTPNMRGIFIFLFVTNTISGFSRFSDLYIICHNSASGGSRAALQSVLMYIYQYSFENPNYGLSSAGVMIVFLIILVVTLINMRTTKLLAK